jgi:hypothetical protein
MSRNLRAVLGVAGLVVAATAIFILSKAVLASESAASTGSSQQNAVPSQSSPSASSTSAGPSQSDANIRAYWTEDRKRSARAAPMPKADSLAPSDPKAGSRPKPDGPESSHPASTPLPK